MQPDSTGGQAVSQPAVSLGSSVISMVSTCVQATLALARTVPGHEASTPERDQLAPSWPKGQRPLHRDIQCAGCNSRTIHNEGLVGTTPGKC
jgi:hypothetical protein